MGFVLPLKDRQKNVYPDGYSMLAEFHSIKKKKDILVVFDNYRDEAARQEDPDNFIGQTIYRAGEARQPARLAYDGITKVDAAALAKYGVTVAGGAATSDGTPFDPAAPAVMTANGVTILYPPMPSYDDFTKPDAVNPKGTTAQIYGFAGTMPEFHGARVAD